MRLERAQKAAASGPPHLSSTSRGRGGRWSCLLCTTGTSPRLAASSCDTRHPGQNTTLHRKYLVILIKYL